MSRSIIPLPARRGAGGLARLLGWRQVDARSGRRHGRQRDGRRAGAAGSPGAAGTSRDGRHRRHDHDHDRRRQQRRRLHAVDDLHAGRRPVLRQDRQRLQGRLAGMRRLRRRRRLHRRHLHRRAELPADHLHLRAAAPGTAAPSATAAAKLDCGACADRRGLHRGRLRERRLRAADLHVRHHALLRHDRRRLRRDARVRRLRRRNVDRAAAAAYRASARRPTARRSPATRRAAASTAAASATAAAACSTARPARAAWRAAPARRPASARASRAQQYVVFCTCYLASLRIAQCVNLDKCYQLY